MSTPSEKKVITRLEQKFESLQGMLSTLMKAQVPKSQKPGKMSSKSKRSKNGEVNNPMVPFLSKNFVGNAKFIRTPQIGIPDLKNFSTSWVMGSAYVGNGTLGATNKVYFQTLSSVNWTSATPIPIAPASTDLGATYILAIEKLFRRKVYRKLVLYAIPVQSSTTNNMTLTIAPVRGPPGTGELAVGSTDTTAAPFTQSQLMSYNGQETVDSFEPMCMDLTPYIAGGSGALQNEFNIAAIGYTSASIISGNASDFLGVLPASFVLAGNSTVSALQGSITHLIVVVQICDYLDFTGAVPVVDPIGMMKVEEKEQEYIRIPKPK